jgi:hypothetical protein
MFLNSLSRMGFPVEFEYKICLKFQANDRELPVLFAERRLGNQHIHLNLEAALVPNKGLTTVLVKPLWQCSSPLHCHYVPKELEDFMNYSLNRKAPKIEEHLSLFEDGSISPKTVTTLARRTAKIYLTENYNN